MDLSIVLPVVNECQNLTVLIPRMRDAIERERLSFEFIVVHGNSTDGTPSAASELGAKVMRERWPGYAGALKTGFSEASGKYVLTMDADLSHEPDFVAKLWRARAQADIVIASRYVRGGIAYTSFLRMFLSRALNVGMRRLLSMPVRDLSSGFRLYRREVLADLELEGHNFEILEEILVKAYANGCSIAEVPFTYFPRESGRSHARLMRFGWDLTRSTLKLWQLRNSVVSADYDDRAFFSIVPLQRYWQRHRHRIITFWARGAKRVLDIGCGSSLIIQSLNNAIGMDISLGKLRFLRRYGIPLVRGSAFSLPFKDNSFDCLISSQVIEHIPYAGELFAEMNRVLRLDGMLLIGTPDYATIGWRLLAPLRETVMLRRYRGEHITHYTRQSLMDILLRHGFVCEETTYVAQSELIMRMRKKETLRVGGTAPTGICRSNVAA